MKKVVVTIEDAGMRLDKFLTSAFAKASAGQGEFFLMSRNEIVTQLKNGKVLVNGKVEKPSYIIKEGDILEIGLVEAEKGLVANSEMTIEVIHEDENLIVVNKPAGVQVHPGHMKEQDTLANWLVAKYPEIVDVHDDSPDAQLRPGIVHRLDKDTSGVMVIARNKESFVGLKMLFHDRKIEKTYVALAKGIFDEKSGLIDKPIARATTYRKQVIARKNTKTIVREAVTGYKVLGEKGELSLVEVRPKTGRMHQIRVHLASIGHPIIGDALYGADNLGQKLAKRQMLHAYRLKFKYLGKEYAFFAPILEDMLEAGASIDLEKWPVLGNKYAKKVL